LAGFAVEARKHSIHYNKLACVAGARKGKGEKKLRARAREVGGGEGGTEASPSPSLHVFRACPIFPSPFPFLAPARQANNKQTGL